MPLQKSNFNILMEKYEVNICLYGHLHGTGIQHSVEGLIDGIRYNFVAADFLKFIPTKIY